jgi:MFS family permease
MIFSLVLTSVATSLPVLFVGVLLLRFSGQGLMTQIGGVSTSRFFGSRRGKALAVVGLGFSLGTAIFPASLAWGIAELGWQATLRWVAALVAVIFLPGCLGLLRSREGFHRPPSRSAEDGEVATGVERRDVLRTPFFYFALPSSLLIPFMSTGLIIHLGRVAEFKQWDLTFVTSCFVASAVAGRVGSFVIGPLVDRFTARRLFRILLFPYVLALGVLVEVAHPYAAVAWLGIGGLSVGCTAVTMSSLWAEMFGVRRLGAIGSMASATGVFATALSPFLFGWLLDHGLAVDRLVYSGICATLVVIALAFVAPRPPRLAISE